jgi:hypothetical protein
MVNGSAAQDATRLVQTLAWQPSAVHIPIANEPKPIADPCSIERTLKDVLGSGSMASI